MSISCYHMGTNNKQVLQSTVIWEQRLALAQLCNEVPICYNGTPQIHPQNCLFPCDDHHPYLIHPFLDRPLSPSQTASGSIQPFCYSTLCGPTDTQTHLRDNSVRITLTLPTVLIESDALTTRPKHAGKSQTWSAHKPIHAHCLTCVTFL